MKPNELRIGNLVYFNHCDYNKFTPMKINYTKNPNILGLERVTVNRIEYNNIEPIPFTEEWITRFSMMKIGANLQVGIITLWKNINDGMYYFRYDGISVKISFIHQLQNLYFAIAGEELTYENETK